MKYLAFCVFLLVVFVSPAFAHDASLHKGPMIEGKLISIQGDKVEVQTKSEKTTVQLSAETKYELGEEGKPGTISDLKPGCDLMAHGHKLATGEFGASEVLINPAHHENEASHEHSHDSK